MTEGKKMKFAEYEERIAGLPGCSLRWIIADCKETLRLQPDSPNAGYYQDEILLCSQELTRRSQKRKRVCREIQFGKTLTEVWTILKDAGYVGEDMLDELRELVNDSKRPATESAETVDFEAKYNELIEAILSWASTPQNHGGNPYGHDFMKLVPWKNRR